MKFYATKYASDLRERFHNEQLLRLVYNSLLSGEENISANLFRPALSQNSKNLFFI